MWELFRILTYLGASLIAGKSIYDNVVNDFKKKIGRAHV